MGLPLKHDDVEESPEPIIDDDDETVAMQSPCVHCGRLGEMRLQSRALPGFTDELMVMAFQCLLCGFKNDEVQFAGQYGPQAVRYTLEVQEGGTSGLSRQLLKSETAALLIPEFEFEIPGSLVDVNVLTRGDLTTVEGLLRSTVANLQLNQAERAPEVAEKIEECIQELLRCASGQQAFTIVMEDPSGNSFISGAEAEGEGSLLQVEWYDRTPQQQAALGLGLPAVAEEGEEEPAAVEEPGAAAGGSDQ